MSNEQARMLLPLAWLIRVNDTALHRHWLDLMITDLLDSQQQCGAIKQRFGTGNEASRCRPCAPRSNADYGSGEGPIMFSGNESLTDSLYTLNFALAGLREAVGATSDPTGRYRRAESMLASYMVKIQVRSIEHPELNGAWFRAFDYKSEEYFASDLALPRPPRARAQRTVSAPTRWSP